MAERESGRTLPCDPPAQRWPSACPVASASSCLVFGGCGEGGRGRCLEEGERGGKEARERQFFLSVWFQHPTTSGLDFWAPHSSGRPRRPGVRPLLAQPPANPWPLSKHAEADATRAPPPQACRSASPRPGARTVRSLTSSHSPMAILSRAKGCAGAGYIKINSLTLRELLVQWGDEFFRR